MSELSSGKEMSGNGSSKETVSGSSSETASGSSSETVSGSSSETVNGFSGVESGKSSVTKGIGNGELSNGNEKEGEGIKDLPVNLNNTTVGRNQILETPIKYDETQNNVETFHEESLKQIMELNEKYMPESSIERINNGVDSIKTENYNGNSKLGSFSFNKGKSQIEVVNKNVSQLERTTRHETHHFSSLNREIIVPGKGGYTVHKTSGVRQLSWFHNNETGEKTYISEKNRGLNEGITTMYTNRQLEAVSTEKAQQAARETGYQQSTEICQQLEQIVGKDAVASAYYGGDIKGLEKKVDELGGEKSFENLSKCAEKVTYSKDKGERINAMKEAQEILARMEEGRKLK